MEAVYGGDVASVGSNDSYLDEQRNKEEPKSDVHDFFGTETRQVFCARSALVLVVFIVTLAVSFASYWTLNKTEQNTFETSWDGHSTASISAFLHDLNLHLGTAAELSVQFTSYALFRGLTWPFVTIPDFAFSAIPFRYQSDTVHFSVNPIVTQAQRAQWELYVQENQAWVNQSIAEEKQAPTDYMLYDQIFQVEQQDSGYIPVPVSGNGPFYPMWQK